MCVCCVSELTQDLSFRVLSSDIRINSGLFLLRSVVIRAGVDECQRIKYTISDSASAAGCIKHKGLLLLAGHSGWMTELV